MSDTSQTSPTCDQPPNPQLRVVQHELFGRIATSVAFLPHLSGRADLGTDTVRQVLSVLYDQDLRRWRDWSPEHVCPPASFFSHIVSLCELKDRVTFLDGRDESVESKAQSHIIPKIPVIPSFSEDIRSSLFDLALCARQILSSQSAINYLYGILLSPSQTIYVRFDRAGAILSDAFDPNLEPLVFLNTLIGIVTLSMLSVDTTLSFVDDQEIFPGRSGGGECTQYVTQDCLHRNLAVQGSAARVLAVTEDSHPERQFVLKDWWRSEDKIDEGEVLRIASGRFGLPEYVSHWAVSDSDGSLQNTHFLDDSLVPIAIHISSGKSTGDEGGGDFDSERPRLEREHRIHSRLVVKEKGEHLLKFRCSPLIVLTAIHDAILGHRSLYQAGYLHRDVSYGNLLVLPSPIPATHYSNFASLPVPAVNNQCTAVLNDFDNAIRLSDVYADEQKDDELLRDPRGTTIYMSATLLMTSKRKGSLVHDDLESFLWILVVVAAWAKLPDPSSPGWKGSFDNWVRQLLFPANGLSDRDTLGVRKLGLLGLMAGRFIPPQWYDPIAKKYSDVIKEWSAYTLKAFSEKPRASDEEYYLDVLKLLRSAIDTLNSDTSAFSQ